MVLDGLDVVLIDAIGLGGFGGHYHATDKVLDQYYLTIELIVALRWDNPWAKWPAAALFAFRLVGVILFEITGTRLMLFLFPNLFELWWLYVVAVVRFRPEWTPRSWAMVLVSLAILLVPKMAQEWLVHCAVVQPWNGTKEHVL
jgi:hypothetical protein